MKKKIGILLCAVSILLCVFAFAACGGEEGKKGGLKTYTMEAEYINLDGKAGASVSHQAKGVNMIYGDGTDAQKEEWSNGYYVGFTYSANLQLDFVFTADEAETATVVLRLGSEIGDLPLTPSAFAVRLNGEDIAYSTMLVTNSPSMAEMKFTDKTVSSAAVTIKGENTLSLIVLDNELHGGQPGGPTIDCVKITTKAKLDWVDKTDNPGRRGAI